MDSITLRPWGTIRVQRPRSFAAISDVALGWTSASGDAGRRVRLCAAAVGLTWIEQSGGQRKLPRMPVYDVGLAEAVAYGGRVLDVLYAAGVPQADLVDAGFALVEWLDSLIPSVEEVQTVVDFSDAPPVLSIGGSSE